MRGRENSGSVQSSQTRHVNFKVVEREEPHTTLSLKFLKFQQKKKKKESMELNEKGIDGIERNTNLHII